MFLTTDPLRSPQRLGLKERDPIMLCRLEDTLCAIATKALSLIFASIGAIFKLVAIGLD